MWKPKSDAMQLKFDYREINNSYNVVPLKVTYENDDGVKPPKINGDEEDDLVRNAYVGISSAG